MSMQMRIHYSYIVFVLKLNVTWFLWLLRECRLQDRREKKPRQKPEKQIGKRKVTEMEINGGKKMLRFQTSKTSNQYITFSPYFLL